MSVISRLLELRDTFTGIHAGRSVELARTLAVAAGVPPAQLPYLHWGATLHDIGKIGIPDSILRKPGPLTAAERQVIERHPDLGHHAVSGLAGLGDALLVVRHHHERWDGAGYPGRLRGRTIPVLARIFSVVDAYDAMTNVRPYRRPMPHADAVAELRRCAGTQFDPAIVALFVAGGEARRLGA